MKFYRTRSTRSNGNIESDLRRLEKIIGLHHGPKLRAKRPATHKPNSVLQSLAPAITKSLISSLTGSRNAGSQVSSLLKGGFTGSKGFSPTSHQRLSSLASAITRSFSRDL